MYDAMVYVLAKSTGDCISKKKFSDPQEMLDYLNAHNAFDSSIDKRFEILFVRGHREFEAIMPWVSNNVKVDYLAS
jgi:hypothetical protein